MPYSKNKPVDELESINETAYRRGVHQTLAMLEFFLEETGADINQVLPLAVKKARDIRGSAKDASFLLHGLFEEIKAELERKPAKRAVKKPPKC